MEQHVLPSMKRMVDALEMRGANAQNDRANLPYSETEASQKFKQGDEVHGMARAKIKHVTRWYVIPKNSGLYNKNSWQVTLEYQGKRHLPLPTAELD